MKTKDEIKEWLKSRGVTNRLYRGASVDINRIMETDPEILIDSFACWELTVEGHSFWKVESNLYRNWYK